LPAQAVTLTSVRGDTRTPDRIVSQGAAQAALPRRGRPCATADRLRGPLPRI